MDEPALTGHLALGRQVARPVARGGLWHRQHQGDLGKAAVGRRERAGTEVLRRDGVMRKEARGGFAHGAIATGFGKGGCGVLGQDASEFSQALGAPQIAEVGISTFAERPVVVIGLATHAQLLRQQVTLGVAVWT